MYGDRRCPEFIDGMHRFLDVVKLNKLKNGFMICPCDECRNTRNYPSVRTIHSHLLRQGFMPNYFCWTKHGERGVMMEDSEEEDDDNYPVFSEHGDTTMGEDEVELEVIVDESDDDDLRRVILDEQLNCGSENERSKLERMLQDHNKLLYPNYEDG